jgi:FkbH-like protein
MNAKFTGRPEIAAETRIHALDNKIPHKSASALLPTALRPNSSRKLSIAVLGTCMAHGFANSCDTDHCKVDHFLMQILHNTFTSDVKHVPFEQYDAILVHLTLRQVLRGLTDSIKHDLLQFRAIPDYEEMLASATQNLTRVITSVVQSIHGAKPTFFLSFSEPPSTYQGILLNNRRNSFYHLVRTLNDQMAEALEGIENAYYIEINDLIRYYGDARVSDAYLFHFTHASFQPSKESKAMRLAIIERIRNALTILAQESPIKLIVTDLDNTLWKGVLAELDEIVPGKHVEGWPLGYVEALLEFKRRGGLLAICSKNDFEQTVHRFNKVWRNRLRLADFCSVKINWEPKSTNIAAILSETNILPSNVLFIDDNPREIEEVKQAYPEIRTLTGEQRAWRSIIMWSAETQVATVSEESTLRTEMIKAKRQRDLSASEMSRDDYLKSLKIRVHFDIISDSSNPKYARAVELINKTNQFNTTGRRWEAPDLQALFATGGFFVALSAIDKFGDNGLVSVAIVCDCEVIQMVMSCRVFGFSLETALLCRVFEILHGERSRGKVVGRLIDTGKNKTCALLYKSNGFVEIENANGKWQSEHAPGWPNWIERA